MEEEIIDIRDLKKTYLMGKVKVPALKGVDIKIKRGEFVAVMGPSGSGKTTLLELTGTLLSPSEGNITLSGKSISSMDENRRADFRLKNLGFVFQFFNLFMELTAVENVMLPKLMEGFSKKECRKTAAELLALVGLEKRINHKPSELSGGEQQRVAIARALINKPKILFADEPCANLDSISSKQILELFKKLNKELGQTIVMVTHEDWHKKYVDRVIYLRDGLIEKRKN